MKFILTENGNEAVDLAFVDIFNIGKIIYKDAKNFA